MNMTRSVRTSIIAILFTPLMFVSLISQAQSRNEFETLAFDSDDRQADLYDLNSFTVQDYEHAGSTISAICILASSVTFYCVSDKGIVATGGMTAVSTALTLLYNGQIRGLKNFPARFSEYINDVGSSFERSISNGAAVPNARIRRSANEIGRFAAIVPPALIGTALFVLFANALDFKSTFGSMSAIGFIIVQTSSGLSTNAAWDIFEAEVRKDSGAKVDSEELARLSLYTRQLFGSVVGPIFYLPGGTKIAATILGMHGLLGLVAVVRAEQAIDIFRKFKMHLDQSKSFLKLVKVRRLLGARTDQACEFLLRRRR